MEKLKSMWKWIGNEGRLLEEINGNLKDALLFEKVWNIAGGGKLYEVLRYCSMIHADRSYFLLKSWLMPLVAIR